MRFNWRQGKSGPRSTQVRITYRLYADDLIVLACMEAQACVDPWAPTDTPLGDWERDNLPATKSELEKVVRQRLEDYGQRGQPEADCHPEAIDIMRQRVAEWYGVDVPARDMVDNHFHPC